MEKYKNILAATDFSAHAERALFAAVRMAREHRAMLHLAHIVATPLFYSEMPEIALPPMADVGQALCLSGRKKLEQWAAEHAADLNAKIHVVESPARPADAIAEIAAESQSDLIVIGSHGHSGLMRVLLGSTAERVVREAACDVLVVKARNAA